MGSKQKRKRKKRMERACTSKIAYPSLKSAINAAMRLNLNWYRCPYCHKWHLTRNVRRKPTHFR